MSLFKIRIYLCLAFVLLPIASAQAVQISSDSLQSGKTYAVFTGDVHLTLANSEQFKITSDAIDLSESNGKYAGNVTISVADTVYLMDEVWIEKLGDGTVSFSSDRMIQLNAFREQTLKCKKIERDTRDNSL